MVHLKLDRETEALIYWSSSSTATPLWRLSPEEARAEYRRTLSKTEIAPPDIGEVGDLAVPGPAGPMRVRKYAPAEPGREPGAAILFMHGGGCVIGDVETHDIFCRALCHDTGATVFSLDYRLAPEHPFPAAVEDTVAALDLAVARGGLARPRSGADRDSRRQRGRRARGRCPARDQGRARRASARPGLDLSRARPARTAAVAHGARGALPHPARHDRLVLRSLFRARLAVHRPACDSFAVRGLYAACRRR